jgi:hypothetical protein
MLVHKPLNTAASRIKSLNRALVLGAVLVEFFLPQPL